MEHRIMCTSQDAVFAVLIYLFKIKYWTSFPNGALLNRVVKRMEDLRSAYETKSQRLSKSILMIVTLDENKSSFQEHLNHYASKHSMSFDYRVYTENEL